MLQNRKHRSLSGIVLAFVLVMMVSTPTSAGPAVSPSTPVVDGEDADIVRFTPSVRKVAELKSGGYYSGGQYFGTPSISGDGTVVAYGTETDAGYEMRRVDTATGVDELVWETEAPYGAYDPVLSVDGSRIAFSGRLPEWGAAGVWLWDQATGTVELIGDPELHQVYSLGNIHITSDGGVVVWTERTGEAWRDRRVVIWDNGVRQVMPGAVSDLADDGRYLWMTTLEEQILYDLNTGDRQHLPGGGRIADDGGIVAYSGYRGVQEPGNWGTIAKSVAAGELFFVHVPIDSYNPPWFKLSGDGSTLVVDYKDGFDLIVDVDSHHTSLMELPYHHLFDLTDDGTTALYGDRLGGSYPDSARWELKLVSLVPPPPTVAAVGDLSRPQLSDQVRRLYKAVFLRDADADGLEAWAGRRAGGMSLLEVADTFVESPEFQNRYGSVSDEEFVRLIYHNVLGRDPDANGFAVWVGRLGEGMTRAELVVGFSESPEFINTTGTAPVSDPQSAQIWRLYQAYFLRPADQAGLDAWRQRYAEGMPLTAISGSFASSPEFVSRYGSLTDRQFVELVYLNVLGRKGDQPGVDNWVGRLAGGMSRGAMMVGFSESPEFILRTDTIPPGG